MMEIEIADGCTTLRKFPKPGNNFVGPAFSVCKIPSFWLSSIIKAK